MGFPAPPSSAPALPTLVIPYPALRRFLVRAVAFTLALGLPAAAAAFVLSNRAEPVFAAEATLLAPLRSLQVDLPADAPAASRPLLPAAYASALRDADVLADAWRRLEPEATAEPSLADLESLAAKVSLRFEERPRSTLMMIGAEGGTAAESTARANAVSAAVIAWDDARARGEAADTVASLESHLAALEQQLVELRSLGGRAAVPQVNALSLLTVELRQSLAEARSLTVAARGNLELLQPATRPSQVRPSPLVNAVVAAGLSGILVVALLLVSGGRDRRVHTAAGLAEISGLPLLAAFSDVPKRQRRRRTGLTRRRNDTALPYLKAQVDRALRRGGNLLVVGMSENDSSDAVARALADLYEVPGSATFVTSSPSLLTSGVAMSKAASADATIVVADPRQTDRIQLREAVAWLRRANATVLGIVASPSRRRTPGPRQEGGPAR